MPDVRIYTKEIRQCGSAGGCPYFTAQVEALRAALRPFAAAWQNGHERLDDGTRAIYPTRLRAPCEAWEAAAEALATKPVDLLAAHDARVRAEALAPFAQWMEKGHGPNWSELNRDLLTPIETIIVNEWLRRKKGGA